MASNSKIVSLYLLEKFEDRNRGGREFLKGFAAGGDDLFDVYVNDLSLLGAEELKRIKELKPKCFFGIKNGTVERPVSDDPAGKISIFRRTKIFFKHAEFDFAKDLVNEYLDPPYLSFAEVQKSPNKKRACVSGSIKQVGDVRVVGNKRLRVLSLSDGKDAMKLSLWGEHADIPLALNDEVCLSGVMITEYQDRKQLESSANFSVEAKKEALEVVGEVIAVSSESFSLPYDIIMVAGEEEYEVIVTEASKVNIDLDNLPATACLGMHQSANRKECVYLTRVPDEDNATPV